MTSQQAGEHLPDVSRERNSWCGALDGREAELLHYLEMSLNLR